MTEAPKVISDFSIDVENEGKKYEIILSQKSNNLLIISKDLNSFPSKRYEEEFTKNNFNQISKFFMFFNDISEIFTELKIKIEENKFKINVNENKFVLLFKVDISNINEFSIELKRKEEDLKSIVESLCSIIKKQEEKINKFEEESNIKINKLEEKIKKLEDEKNETNNKTNKLENEIKEIKEKLLPLKEEKDKEEKFYNFKESKIIKNNDDKILISNWIFPNSKIKFNLLYQISRDGDNISTFYNKVKDKCPTLIIVK